jgi:polysaccharide biosynthesis protein PslL
MTVRNQTIDIAKGIGIMLVVFGHNWIVLHEKGVLFRTIFSFHMPLFFFLSGVLLKDAGSLKQFIVTKADSLLKPYFVVTICLGIGKIFAHPTTWFKYLFGVIYATNVTIEWEPLWFLPHLFVALLAVWMMLRVTQHFERRSLWITFIAAILLAIGGTFIDVFWRIDLSNWIYIDTFFDRVKHLPGLPFSIDLIWLSSAYILIGFLARQHVKSINFHAPAFFSAAIVFALLQYYFDRTTDLAARLYGDVFTSSLQAILGIYITIALSALVANWMLARRILTYIGSSTLFILIFHDVLQSKTFYILDRLSKLSYLSGMLSLIAGVLLPIVLLEIVKRQRFLAAMLLPRKLNFSKNGK